jgi:hypothetical protein
MRGKGSIKLRESIVGNDWNFPQGKDVSSRVHGKKGRAVATTNESSLKKKG